MKDILKNGLIFLCRLFAILVIFFITLISNSEWCYFSLIVLIAYCSGLISKDLQKFIIKIFNKDLKVEELSSIEIALKEIKEKLDNVLGLTNRENNKNNLESSYEQLKRFESNVIKWFELEKNLLFKQNKRIARANSTIYIPDGICELKRKDIILEIKTCPTSYSNMVSLANIFKNCNEEYIKANKKVVFYLALVSKNLNLDNQIKLLEKVKKEICVDNLKIYIFKEEGNNINLLKEN